MRKRMLRLLLGALIGWILASPGQWSGAVAASDSEIALYGTYSKYTFAPASNGVYAGYLFSTGNLRIDRAELYQNGVLTARSFGGTKLFSARLSAGTVYELRIYGSGKGRIEIARETLSRCFDNPLEMQEGGEYQKAIARSGDVHWYAFTAQTDGAELIAVMPMEENVSLSAWLVDDDGKILMESDDLEMGACFLSPAVVSGAQYRIRIFARDGATGKYTLRIQSGAAAKKADAIALSRTQITLNGRARTSVTASVSPAGSSGLAAFASENPKIAAVRKNGVVEGRAPGTTRIFAYAYGGAIAVCEVTVVDVPAESISVSISQSEAEIGDAARLNASVYPVNATDSKITFTSDDPSVASVDERGNITAVGEGVAVITASASGGSISESVEFTVRTAQKRYRALLIGEQNYASTVQSVRVGSKRSIESIESLLKTARFSGASCEVTTLMDQPRDSVIAGIREVFADATAQDVSIIYITCHGFYKAGMTFFVMADGSVLSAVELERELRDIPGEIVLLADCCGSGGLLGEAGSPEKMIEGVTSVFQGAIGKTNLGTSKYHVLASALLDQDSHRISFSGSDEEDMATVFARALCDALGWSMDRNAQSAMNADTDYDGNVTFEEMCRYVSKRVKWYLSLAGEYAQNVVSSAQGDMFVVFARND